MILTGLIKHVLTSIRTFIIIFLYTTHTFLSKIENLAILIVKMANIQFIVSLRCGQILHTPSCSAHQ